LCDICNVCCRNQIVSLSRQVVCGFQGSVTKAIIQTPMHKFWCMGFVMVEAEIKF
jgi:hypothetical protein